MRDYYGCWWIGLLGSGVFGYGTRTRADESGLCLGDYGARGHLEMGRGRERTRADYVWEIVRFGGIWKWDADESRRERILLGNPCDIFPVIVEYFSAVSWFGAEVKE